MTSLKCPNCALVNFAESNVCKRCGANLPTNSDFFSSRTETPPPAQDQARPDEVKKPKSIETGAILNAICWLILIPILALDFASFISSLASAESAPQQAAAAAIALVWAIIPYCGVRAVSEIIRSLSGK